MLFWNDPLEEQGDRKWGWGSCECQRREKPLGGGGYGGNFLNLESLKCHFLHLGRRFCFTLI